MGEPLLEGEADLPQRRISVPGVKPLFGGVLLVTAIGAAACGGGGSKAASGTTLAPSSGSSTTVAHVASGSPVFCSQVNAVLNQFKAVSSPTSTDIAKAATSFDHLSAAGPATLKTSLSATAGDFRQLVTIMKTDPQALTREKPTPEESSLATKLQGDLTPLVTYQKTCPA